MKIFYSQWRWWIRQPPPPLFLPSFLCHLIMWEIFSLDPFLVASSDKKVQRRWKLINFFVWCYGWEKVRRRNFRGFGWKQEICGFVRFYTDRKIEVMKNKYKFVQEVLIKIEYQLHTNFLIRLMIYMRFGYVVYLMHLKCVPNIDYQVNFFC